MSTSVLAPVVVTVGRPFLIAESPAYGWGVLSHPRLIKVSDDLIVLRYYVGGDNKNWDNPGARDIKGKSPAISRDGGKTWVFGEEHLDPQVAERTYYWGYDIETEAGTVIGAKGQAVFMGPGENILAGPWSLVLDTNGFVSGGPWHKGAVLDDGTLIAVSYADKAEFRGAKKKKSCYHLLASTDTGLTWVVRSRVAGPEDAPWAHRWPLGFEGPAEAAIVALPDNEILCVARTGMKRTTVYEAAKDSIRMIQSTSPDRGVTWKHKEMTFEGVYPKMCRMHNNVVALAFGRPGNNLAFTVNGGFTWGAEVAITPPQAKTSGYCDLVEVEPGKLLVVFDLHSTDLSGFWLWEPKLQNGIFGVFVHVKRLVPGGGR